MTKFLLPCLALPLLAACAATPAAPSTGLVLAVHGRSDYALVIPAAADPAERRAAEELQAHLEKICGARLPITPDSAPEAAHEILVGRARAAAHPLATPANPEGFHVATQGEQLLIRGSSPRGTLYGAYTLLEEKFGCRWFAPDATRIPHADNLRLPPTDFSEAPAFEFRQLMGDSAADPRWLAHNRVNASFRAPIPAELGGETKFVPDYFVHTLVNKIVTPKEYFAGHPEYFALVGKERKPTQLCLTHPEVRRLALEQVRRELRAHPECTVISVSQNDGGGACECPACRAVVKREGSQSGPILELVNFVAAGIKDEFPDKAVHTLAYYYSEKAPKTLRPLPNVIVQLCSYGCCSGHPLETCPSEASARFRDNLRDWNRLTNRLWIWDYSVNYANFVQPFPNLQTLGPNAGYLAAHGVKGVFEEGDYLNTGSELQELRLYVLAKCLWNPACDARRAAAEFADGYYGPAAPAIHRYLRLLEAAGSRADTHVGLYDRPTAKYLDAAFMAQAQAAFNEAEKLAANDPAALRRVRIARLPVDYVALATWKPGDARSPAEIGALADRFAEVGEAAGIKTLHEGKRITPRAFAERVKGKAEGR